MASQIEEAVVSLLLSRTALRGVVGDRVRPELPAQADQFPALVYDKADDGRGRTAAGTVKLSHAIITLGCWADSYGEAKHLRSLLTAEHPSGLNGYRGEVLGVPIRSVFVRETADLLEAGVGADEQRKYGVALELDVWYREG